MFFHRLTYKMEREFALKVDASATYRTSENVVSIYMEVSNGNQKSCGKEYNKVFQKIAEII